MLFLRYFIKHVNLTDKPQHKVKWGKMASLKGKNKEEMLLRHQEEKNHTHKKQLILEWPRFRDNCEAAIGKRSREG